MVYVGLVTRHLESSWLRFLDLELDLGPDIAVVQLQMRLIHRLFAHYCENDDDAFFILRTLIILTDDQFKKPLVQFDHWDSKSTEL